MGSRLYYQDKTLDDNVDYEHTIDMDSNNSIHVFSELINPISLEDIKPARLGARNLRLSWIQILRPGRWNHPVYGPIDINEKTFEDLKKHHEENVRGIDIAIDTEHKEDKGAVGWIKKLEIRPSGLWALVDWTKKGLGLIKDKVYRYVSAEFSPKYEDPETKKITPNVLIAVTLTNRPFIKRMAPILLSEVFPGFKERIISEWKSQQVSNNLVSPDYSNKNNRGFKRTGNKKPTVEEGDVSESNREFIRSLKLRRKKGGIQMSYADVDSGLDLDDETFSELVQEPEEFVDYEYDEPEYYDDAVDDDWEFDDDDDDYNDDYSEDWEFDDDYDNWEFDEPEYDEPEYDEEYEFDEPEVPVVPVASTVDPEARSVAMELSEQVAQLQEQNYQLQEALKFEAVEGIVDDWIADERGIGKIPPQLKDLAIDMLMSFDEEDATKFMRFVESLPGCFDYTERGMSVQDDMISTDLQLRARQIYAEGQKVDKNFQFRDALKQAYMELYES